MDHSPLRTFELSVLCDSCFQQKLEDSLEASSPEEAWHLLEGKARSLGWEVSSEGDLTCPLCICR